MTYPEWAPLDLVEQQEWNRQDLERLLELPDHVKKDAGVLRAKCDFYDKLLRHHAMILVWEQLQELERFSLHGDAICEAFMRETFDAYHYGPSAWDLLSPSTRPDKASKIAKEARKLAGLVRDYLPNESTNYIDSTEKAMPKIATIPEKLAMSADAVPTMTRPKKLGEIAKRARALAGLLRVYLPNRFVLEYFTPLEHEGYWEAARCYDVTAPSVATILERLATSVELAAPYYDCLIDRPNNEGRARLYFFKRLNRFFEQVCETPLWSALETTAQVVFDDPTISKQQVRDAVKVKNRRPPGNAFE
jgi:hypothetical protein